MLFSRFGFLVLLVLAMAFSACSSSSDHKWKLTVLDGTSQKMKVNDVEVMPSATVEVAQLKKDESAELKIAFQTDGIYYDATTFVVKPTASPVNDGDPLLVSITIPTSTDSTAKVVATGVGVAISVK